MKKSLTLALAAATTVAAIAATSANAASFRAYNRVTVNPVAGGTFEALETAQYGQRGMWCAAADYAISVLGADGTDRVYVQTPRGDSVTKPGRKGVVFGLSVPAGASDVPVLSINAALRVPGSSLSVDHAFQFCYDSRLQSGRS